MRGSTEYLLQSDMKRFGYSFGHVEAHVKKNVGSYAEPTEFLVQRLDGKLVIVNWYTNGKDSYDSTVRGENQKIDNPDIRDNSERIPK